MEPAFYRGDILFLWNPESEPYVVGDITVYKMWVPSPLPLELNLRGGVGMLI
jgi:signal peptidase I